jgi:peptide-methionine (S)-S-oxide reductase
MQLKHNHKISIWLDFARLKGDDNMIEFVRRTCLQFSFLLSVIFFSLVFLLPSQRAFAEKAIFAGGCFWCMEADFEKLEGVSDVVSGYTGGSVDNPTYKQVTAGNTGHYEAVEITYDPNVITYQTLLEYFFANIDPFDKDGQFCDRGSSYRAAVFFGNEQEKQIALKAKEVVEEQTNKPVLAPVLNQTSFYVAEDYHQDYYKKNPKRYSFYRWSCGRDSRLEELWGDRKKLDLF